MNFKNLAMWGIIVFLTIGLYNMFKNPQSNMSSKNQINFSEFLSEVDNGRVIQEDQWNFEPIKLYDPPEMNFKNFELVDADKKDSLRNIAKKYYEAFQKTVMVCDS